MEAEHTPRRAPPTIYTVAHHAGVSISTVSLALNWPHRVRPDTLARVQTAVRELGFVPKAGGAVRARRGTRRIGVVGPFTSVPSSMERLRGIIDAAGDDYEIVVHGRESAVLHKHYVDSLALSGKLDGLILIDVPITDHLAHRLVEDRFPTVLVEYPQPGISCVVIDDREGGRIVARYLLERGHRQCAFLGLAWPPDEASEFVTPDILRLEGFREVLVDAGVDLPDSYIKVGYDSAARRQAARELLDLDSHPTAIFATADVGAADILPIPAERGLRVPEDVAIIGFDDADFAAYLGLTTVRQHLVESGRVAVQLLRECLANDASGIAKRVILPLSLVRRSTG